MWWRQSSGEIVFKTGQLTTKKNSENTLNQIKF